MKGALSALVIVQIIAQLCLKGSLNDLWSLYFAMQLICYLTLYDIPLAINAEIYNE